MTSSFSQHDDEAENASDRLARYARQWRFAPLGREGQERLSKSTVLIVGCGALGTVAANTLVRAGVGHVRIVDRDFLELNNLQRQVLFDENDLREGLPKAIAAQRKLQAINSDIVIEGIVGDLNHVTLPKWLDGVDVIVDGTDNFDTRFLINDAAFVHDIPWVYGGCLGSEGQTMTIIPGETACLRCLMPDVPPAGSTPTCDSAGVLGPAINVIASLQAAEAIKLLSGNRTAISRKLMVIDVWDSSLREIKLDGLRENSSCPACNRTDFPWLDGRRGSTAAVLCGRDSVQLSFPGRDPVDLKELEKRLQSSGVVQRNVFLLRLTVEGRTMTIFPDGRAIVGGTSDINEAKSWYARWVGN
jgi:molybdopterin/thiamine biosynthesis adenylyltransferase